MKTTIKSLFTNKTLILVAILAMAMFTPVAQAADPDAPLSGDDCETAEAFNPASTVGTVGGADSVDVFKNPLDEDTRIGFHTLFRSNTYIWEIRDANCERTDWARCRNVVNHACYAGQWVAGAQDIGHGDVPGQHAVVPADGYVVIKPRSAYGPVEPLTHYQFQVSPQASE